MAQRKKGERIRGPYAYRRGGRFVAWRVQILDGNGRTRNKFFKKAERKKAVAFANILRSKLDRMDTLSGAVVGYEKYMIEKGNKRRSIDTTLIRIGSFFSDDHLPLATLSIRKIESKYRKRVEATSVDTHKNELAEVKTFLRWCYKKGLVSKSLNDRLNEVEGIGKRKKGKKQLRVDEGLAWEAKALELANTEAGAVAALCCYYLGLRASEVISLKVRDVDGGGSILWIDESKTEAGVGAANVPIPLSRLLMNLADGKERDEKIFGHHWRDWPCRWVKKICHLAGVPEVTAHGLRGTRASISLINGMPEAAVSQLLRHTGAKVTREHYISPEAGREAQSRGFFQVIEASRAARLAQDEGAQETEDEEKK